MDIDEIKSRIANGVSHWIESHAILHNSDEARIAAAIDASLSDDEIRKLSARHSDASLSRRVTLIFDELRDLVRANLANFEGLDPREIEALARLIQLHGSEVLARA